MPRCWQDLWHHVSLWLIHGLLYFMIAITLALNTVDIIQRGTVWKDCLKDQGGYVPMGNFARQGEDIIHDSQITKEKDKKRICLPAWPRGGRAASCKLWNVTIYMLSSTLFRYTRKFSSYTFTQESAGTNGSAGRAYLPRLLAQLQAPSDG